MSQSNPIDVDFLEVVEIAKLFRVSRPTVYGWIRAGELPAFRLGNTQRVPRDAVEKLLARHTRVAANG